MGLGFEFSRLDESAHPFCSSFYPKDIRMTTRILPNKVTSNIFSVLHEGGHALYARSFLEEDFGTPLAESASLGFDESQSRFWETRIGRSLPFWQYFYPLLQNHFPEQLGNISLHEFYRAIHQVSPSFIRIESDEVTYSLHIILRFEIEKALIEGSMSVKEIPEAWNEKMRSLLGIVPSTFSEGCLQDIHWSMGAFGYFPTYTLGNIYAAQLFSVFENSYPSWAARVAQGDLHFIYEWLSDHVHRHGRQFLPRDLLQRVVKGSLNEKPYLSYLEKKYRDLNKISYTQRDSKFGC
jgi:carboxypeptidase Taq